MQELDRDRVYLAKAKHTIDRHTIPLAGSPRQTRYLPPSPANLGKQDEIRHYVR